MTISLISTHCQKDFAIVLTMHCDMLQWMNDKFTVTINTNTRTQSERETQKKRDILVPNLHVYGVPSWHCKLFVLPFFSCFILENGSNTLLTGQAQVNWIFTKRKPYIFPSVLFKLVGGDCLEYTNPTSSNKVQFHFCIFQFNFVGAYCDSFAYDNATGSENIRSFQSQIV